MEFCPMCKGLLMLKSEKGKMIGICSCGFKRTSGLVISGEESFLNKQVGGGVVNSENFKSEGIFHVCSRCGWDKAEASQIASNESEITIFNCLKCGFSERQAQGSSKA